MSFFTVRMQDGAVEMLDQRLLPRQVEYITLADGEAVARAIEDMAVRGAPAIGITAAMGVAIENTLVEFTAGPVWTRVVDRGLTVDVLVAIDEKEAVEFAVDAGCVEPRVDFAARQRGAKRDRVRAKAAVSILRDAE